jgi:hypothetical protein
MRAKNRSVAWRMAKIAGRQHGNVTAAQLLDVGMSRSGIDRRVHGGVLHREYRGVYRVGHRAPNTAAHYMAAVLACGDGAALAGFALAHHRGLLRGSPPAPEVVVAADRRVRGVIVHRVRSLPDEEVEVRDRIPVTTIARTLVDLASVCPLHELARIHHEARVRFHLEPEAVDEVLDRRPNAPGAALLRAVVHGDTPLLLSRLERGFRRFLRDHGFPMPQFNRPEGAHYVDCRWPEHRFTVELDSFRFHNTRKAWESDHDRARAAHRRGDRFRRFTWRDVFEDQAYMHAQLEARLRGG